MRASQIAPIGPCARVDRPSCGPDKKNPTPSPNHSEQLDIHRLHSPVQTMVPVKYPSRTRMLLASLTTTTDSERCRCARCERGGEDTEETGSERSDGGMLTRCWAHAHYRRRTIRAGKRRYETGRSAYTCAPLTWIAHCGMFVSCACVLRCRLTSSSVFAHSFNTRRIVAVCLVHGALSTSHIAISKFPRDSVEDAFLVSRRRRELDGQEERESCAL